jgi:chromosome segregation ATPase
LHIGEQAQLFSSLYIDLFSPFRCGREANILELELTEKEQLIEVLQDKINEMEDAVRDDVTDLKRTGQKIEELHLEMDQLREESARKCRELESTVEGLRLEKHEILASEVEKFSCLKDRVEELEVENTQLKKVRNESRARADFERRMEDLQNENRDLVRARNKAVRDVEKLKLELDEVQDLLNRRNEVVLVEKVCVNTMTNTQRLWSLHYLKIRIIVN